MIERKQNHWTLILAALCWVVGWAAAVAYGHGFEFQRMVVAIPGVLLAGLLILPGILRDKTFWMPGLLMVGITGIYFAGRALTSPVWDLGKMDLLLVCLGLISLLAGAKILRSERAIQVLLGGLVILFLANAGAAYVQATSDSAYAFLRNPRADQSGVSGLFWHRNYLAGMLELMVPVFLGVAFVSRRNWVRVGFGVLVVVGLVMAFQSNSRAGLFSVGVGCAACFVMWILMGWHEKSKMVRGGLIFSGVVAVALFLSGTWMLVSKVSSERGKSESIEVALATSDARLALAGSAYDQWGESPIVGTGSRTFSYLVIRNWERGRVDRWMGNPEMAHNDYLQTLAEYGVVGFVLVLGTLVLALGRGANRIRTGVRSDHSLAMAVRVGAVGGLCGAMVHSSVDFSLHILPNTLLFSVLVGIALFGGQLPVPPRQGRDRSETTEEEVRGTGSAGWGGVLVMVLVVMAGAGAIIAGGRELRVLPKWVAFEQAVISGGMNGERKKELRGIIAQAPDFRLARTYGRVVMREMVENKELRSPMLPEAIWAMKMAVERHPFDGESRLVYANFLELAGDDESAAREYLEGIEATWRRDQQYGGLGGFSDHLARRAEEYFLARKPERALAFFRRALEYLEGAMKFDNRHSRLRVYQMKKDHLLGRVEFLEGAGIQEANLDGEIPAPPVK